MLNIFIILISFYSFAGLPSKEPSDVIQKAIAQKTLPGAVLNFGLENETLFSEAFGAGTKETIYDLASLTKVVGTATSVIILEEQGKLRTTDKLSDYYPFLKETPKADITIEDLLRHQSGYPASVRSHDAEDYQAFIRRTLSLPLEYNTGSITVYSDVGFIILGDLVQKISGLPLEAFTKRYIFDPLGMNDTGYFVSDTNRCAPTMANRRCLPHDPKAFDLYPNSLGHAGLFSTARDLSIFAKMYLGNGTLMGTRILSSESIVKMISLEGTQIRGLGWDLLSPFASAPRGEVFPEGFSYGHTGHTGTTLWIDPQSKSYYVFLSNRVYLGASETVKPFTALRRELSTMIGKIIYGISSTGEIPQ